MSHAPSSQPGEPTERLQAIRQRLEKATPGPWKRYEGDNEDSKHYRSSIVAGDFHVCRVWADQPNATPDAELIAHAPGDLSYLLGEVASLRQQNAELREETNEIGRFAKLLGAPPLESHPARWVLCTFNEEVARLRKEVRMLAKLAHREPQFFNPLEAMAAETLRDRVLASLVPGEKEVPR